MGTTFRSVGIAGAGTMGIGMVQVFALAGLDTIVYDVNSSLVKSVLSRVEGSLQKGVNRNIYSPDQKDEALSRIRPVTSLDDLKADLIVEAVIEKLEIKQDLLRSLESINSPETVLASNTSSIPITQIAAALTRPERFLGIHFFNPAHIMKLVEVISGVTTDEELVGDVKNWLAAIGKMPVLVKDSPGFIVNRVARSFYTESLRNVEEQKASFEGVDRLLESFGFRMGPFRLMDLIGIDTNYSVTTSMFEQFHQEPRFRPSRLQQKYVDAGWHGKKTRKGFYRYDS